MHRILHFAQDSDTSGFFPQLAKWHDRSRYRMFFATLNPMAPWLRDYMEAQGVECCSCDCTNRAQYSVGMIRLARFLLATNGERSGRAEGGLAVDPDSGVFRRIAAGGHADLLTVERAYDPGRGLLARRGRVGED